MRAWVIGWAAVVVACGAGSVVPRVRAERGRLEVHGHRGCRGLRPENTMAAFEHAVELGVDVLELDLGMSRDGVLVVAHDPEVNEEICAVDPERPLSSRRLRDLTAAEIATLDCGGRGHPRFPEQVRVPGARMPRFAEVLALVERSLGVRVNAEIKTFPDRRDVTRAPEELAAALVELVRARGLAARVIVQSFDPEALRAVGRLAPELARAALVESAADLEPMLATGARILSPKASLIGEGDVARWQARGLRVIPWTVNDVDEMRRLLALGVDGIITDRPDLLLDMLRRAPR